MVCTKESQSFVWFDRPRVVPRRTVVGDIDRRFDNLSRSHHQSHVNCVSSVIMYLFFSYGFVTFGDARARDSLVQKV